MTFYRAIGKRWLDINAGCIAFLSTLPVHAVCAIAVWASSGRPIYYAQHRVGKDGKQFSLYKFRTMKVGTHELSGGYPSADMVTVLGRILRKTSLDELPQLINIIKGDMSIVGPRPALYEQYIRYSPRQRRRVAMRPGLTGLAQVRYRNSATWSVRIESDLEYIDTCTMFRDLLIIMQTLPAVVRGRGIVTVDQTAEQVDDLG